MHSSNLDYVGINDAKFYWVRKKRVGNIRNREKK